MAGKPRRSSERPDLDPAKLRKAAEHVTYEIEMLFFAARDIGGWHASPIAPPEDVKKNMALECFLLHFRNLRSFLCPGSDAPTDDILAGDFLGWRKVKDVAEILPLAVTGKERLDKMLAHLSYARKNFIEARNYGWPTAEMELALLDQMQLFFEKLSPERRSWFPPEEVISNERGMAERDREAVKQAFRRVYQCGNDRIQARIRLSRP